MMMSIWKEKKDYNTINGNRIIILADDGAATDASIIAAARWIKKNNKSRNHLIMLFL
jgi:predicted phosphoribosyltransferase